jgi:hypothetical protein
MLYDLPRQMSSALCLELLRYPDDGLFEFLDDEVDSLAMQQELDGRFGIWRMGTALYGVGLNKCQASRRTSEKKLGLSESLPVDVGHQSYELSSVALQYHHHRVRLTKAALLKNTI